MAKIPGFEVLGYNQPTINVNKAAEMLVRISIMQGRVDEYLERRKNSPKTKKLKK